MIQSSTPAHIVIISSFNHYHYHHNLTGGLEPLMPCLVNGVKTLVTKPWYFVKRPSFLLIWGVYSGTYIVGNAIEAVCERSEQAPFYPKFIGGSLANVTLSVLKDRAFARMFGTGSASQPMTFKSMGLFATRDSMTILASFSLPPVLSEKFQRDYKIEKAFADTSAQLITPCAMQIFSTPLHLLGLDIYNRQSASTNERLAFIRSEYLKTMLARIARIFPAFGIGGVVNRSVRQYGNDRFCYKNQ